MKKLLNKKGFTIVEIIVTLAVLGIVIGPLMTMFITSQKINNEGSKEYQSIQLAQKYMEEIKGMTFVSELSLYDKPGHYVYTKNADIYDIKSEPAEEAPFIVDIGIKPLSTNSAINITPVTYTETFVIKSDSVTKNGVKLTDIYHNNVDITLQNNKIIIGNAELSLNPSVAQIILESNATLNFVDSKVAGQFYIDDYEDSSDTTYKCNVNVYGGLAPNIFILDKITTGEILYEITIKVDGKQILQGTKIFK